MNIKLLQITAAYKPAYIYGGPTMSVAKLCEALVDDGRQVEVLSTTANGSNELEVIPNQPVKVDGVSVTYYKRLTKDHTHLSPALLLALRRKIKEQRARNKEQRNNQLIIHIHAWWNLVSIFSCYIAKWYNIPVLLSPRGMLTHYTQNNRNSFFKSALHFLIGKSLLRYCHIHATSEKEKQDVLQITQPKSITVIPNLVSLPLQEQGTRNKEQGVRSKEQSITHNTQHATRNPFQLLFLSRIEEKKGLDILFDGLAALPIPWSLSIAGNGDTAYVESLKVKAINLKINDHIHWIGQVNNRDKFNLMAKYDLLALTSHNENFANVIIESLSVGTPVLISKNVGLVDYVQTKDFGWICDLTVENIKSKLIEAYYNENSRIRIQMTAPQIISDDFNSRNIIYQYLNLYQQITDGKL